MASFVEMLRTRHADYPEVLYTPELYTDKGQSYWGVRSEYLDLTTQTLSRWMNYHSLVTTETDVRQVVRQLEDMETK